MKIYITLPYFYRGEADAIIHHFQQGVDLIHVRKPDATREEVLQLLLQIPEQYRSRMVIHNHFELVTCCGLKGIHLNKRHPQPPEGYVGHISRSCHTFDEVCQNKEACDYLFLSPVFDSISKRGYKSRFTLEELRKAQADGIIDHKVIALGGVTPQKLSLIASLGFGGAAMMGSVWHQHPPIILTIAGSDSSGGAGIQADIKAISALGGYASSAITAITAQNTLGVQEIFPLTSDIIYKQITSVMDDLEVDAIKIGMVYDARIVHTIAECLKKYHPRCVVYDPVMVSTSGHQLITKECIDCIKSELFPLVTLITPNISEAELLCGKQLRNVQEMEQAAGMLSKQHRVSVLIKGGHLSDENMCDVLFHHDSVYHFADRKIETSNLHGTGCTLSSAIATFLGKGLSLIDAVSEAKIYITEAIRQGKDKCIGHGNGPVWHFI